MKHLFLSSLLLVGACSSADSAPSESNDGGLANDAGGDATVDASIETDAAKSTDGPPPSHDAGDGGDASCTTPFPPDPLRAKRDACTFAAGARVVDTLGLDDAARAAIPITHVLVITEENRSFDHFFGKLADEGQPEAEGWPASFTNPDTHDAGVAPMHAPSMCLPADPPHQGAAMQAGYANGAMNGFVKSAATGGSDGHFAMSYYDGADLPLHYFWANTFSIADRYFGAALGGTWANRDYLYAATSDGITDTGERILTKPTIFDALDAAKVPWAVYTDATPRQDCLGWTTSHAGVAGTAELLHALKTGDLPPVSFADPAASQDEHPTNNVSGGEAWVRSIYEAALASPLWMKLAIVFTYDESGGLFDHVPPPSACMASPDQAAFNRRGIRIPTIVISPWARAHSVSHVVHDHTSILRLIETLHDLPALTARDANADALLDMFDFTCPALVAPAAAPSPSTAACK